jgi:hypothetical protein
MCGIAGIHRRGDQPVPRLGKLADGLLLGISHRGSDATGFLAMKDDGSTQTQKVTEAAALFVLVRNRFAPDARTVLLHTRFATRGRADDPNNAHPVTAGRAAAIHNGTIYNDRELFARYSMERTAEVDSIVIPALIDRLGWANANKALSQLDGGAATAIVHADFPTEVILARTNGYPMHVLVTDTTIVWASERRAIERAWKFAYGRRPNRPTDGTWIVLAERTMLRVNGKVTSEALTRPEARKWAKPTRYTSKGRKGKGRKAGTPTTPKATQAKALPPVQGNLLSVTEHEPWMDTEVDDLMRWGSCSREEAYEAVYGVAMPDPATALEDEYLANLDTLNALIDERDDIEWGL